MKDKVVAIFDDDKDILFLVSLFFKKIGWKVFTFETCTDIIEKVTLSQPDLIMMDNWIPDIGGISATQLIKAHSDYQNIKVLFFSANRDVQKLSIIAGADDYIQKPFDIKDLQERVNNLVN